MIEVKSEARALRQRLQGTVAGLSGLRTSLFQHVLELKMDLKHSFDRFSRGFDTENRPKR